MMFPPKTKKQASQRRYGRGPGSRLGSSYDDTLCAWEVRYASSMWTSQCSRKPGHGPDGIFCKQHAIIQARRDV